MLRYLGISQATPFHPTVTRALTEERPSPRAVSARTVLCLDCSPSIGDQGLAAMKAAALDFVSGIEEVAEQHGLDENLGVVTFGSSTEVAQHLTIDYQAVREAIEKATLGGASPLLEAIVVSMAAILGRGGALRIGHGYTVQPRLILLTDGKASKTDPREGTETWQRTPPHRRITLIRLLNKINNSSSASLPKPFVWVPAGDADKDFLRSLAEIGGGRFVELEALRQECSHYRFQDSVGRGYLAARQLGPRRSWDQAALTTLMSGIFHHMEGLDKAALVEAVRERLAGEEDASESGPSDFRHVFQRPELPPLGTRVSRGPDWKWREQDGGCAGTIISHCPKREGWVRVLWDHGGHNKYRFHPKRDVIVVGTPRHLPPGETITVGVKVRRGPAWGGGNEDGGEGSVGVVNRAKDRKVMVRWPAGNLETYQWGADDKQCLTVLHPDAEQEFHEEKDASIETSPKHIWESDERAVTSAGGEGAAVWQWSPTGWGEWQDYDDVTQGKLEQQFRSRPTSTCIVQRDGDRRVLFRTGQEMQVGKPSCKNFVRRKRVEL